MFSTTKDFILFQLRSLLKCEVAINLFSQQDLKFKAIKQFLPAIREAVKILEEPYVVTKMLQRPKCALSDFFGSLIIMKEKLMLWSKKLIKRTDIAQKLIDAYEKRKGNLMNNEAMISAVFLDRRYSQKQDDEEIALAKLSLCRLWERVRQKKCTDLGITTDGLMETSNESIHFDDFDIEKIFATPKKNHPNANEQTPNEQMSEKRVVVPKEANFSITKDEFMILLHGFEKKYPLINHKNQILDFWKSCKDEFPEIYTVASIINSIPPAQATVERVFSIVSFIFGKHRSRLDEEVLQNILTIRLNKDKLPKIFEDEIASLKAEYDKMDAIE